MLSVVEYAGDNSDLELKVGPQFNFFSDHRLVVLDFGSGVADVEMHASEERILLIANL